MTTRNLRTTIIAVPTIFILGLFLASVGYAGMITYSNFNHDGSDAVDYIVTISDATGGGAFDFTYKVDPSSTYTSAKFTGFFFDAAPKDPANNSPYNSSNLGLTNDVPASEGQAFNTNTVSASGGGATLSTLNLAAGAGSYAGHLFDVAIGWKSNDLSNGETGKFTISNLSGTLSLSDFGAIGLRGQATDGAGGSAKEFQVMADTTVSVPEPASMALIGAGVFVVGFVRRRIRK